MNIRSLIEEATGPGAPDYWEQDDQAWRAFRPSGGALPEAPLAHELAQAGKAASEPLIGIVATEDADSLRFKNALFFLMYSNSLFVYRDLKKLHPRAATAQRPWLEEAVRKIMIRCQGWSDVPAPDRRSISKNTRPGRLATTPIIVDLAAEIARRAGRPAVVRDMAVADGITSLELATLAADRNVVLSVVATDAWLHLYYAEHDGNQAVFKTDGDPVQYEILGKLFRRGRELPESYRKPMKALDSLFDPVRLGRITTIAPEVERAAASADCDITFKEEDLFHPEPDIAEADIIRVADLLVEITPDHRGYFQRGEIIEAVARLGAVVKDGAYLFLDNYRRKMERCGRWRKAAARGQWLRQPIASDMPVVLDGVSGIEMNTEGGR